MAHEVLERPHEGPPRAVPENWSESNGGSMSTFRTRILAPFLLLALTSCGKSGDPVAPSASGNNQAEQAMIAAELAIHPELIDDGLSESPDQAAVGSSAVPSGAHVAAPIDPLFFWRDIRHVERTYEFAFRDTDSTGVATTAVVTVHRQFSGWFNVVARQTSPEGAPTEGHLVQKPLHDHWIRRLLLKRVERSDTERRRWRIAATSAVEVTSRGAETRVQSLRVQSGTLDTTLTDPRAFFRLRRVLHFDPEAEVVLTATTLRNDDVVLLYRPDLRSRFHNNGDNTYTATWKAAAWAGVHHFGVNALAHGTLFDDEAPYDSQSWIVPYVVAPTELADLAP